MDYTLQINDGIIRIQGVEYRERILSKRLIRLAETFPAVVVAGARQVGKSTLIRHVFPKDADYVLFDPTVDVENARQDSDLFFDNHLKRPLLLDEIQYAPEIVGALKRRVDADRRPGQFIITGSQQWEVMKSISESLAGRAVFIDLCGFSLAEAAGAAQSGGWLEHWLNEPERLIEKNVRCLEVERSLYEILWRGFLPEADRLALDVLPDFFNAYLRTYIDRDARLLADVSDWHSFNRFFRLSAALTAQDVNYSQLGRDIGLTPQTAHRWLDMLNATFQYETIAAYAGNTVKRLSGKPKGYISDTGLACAAQQISSPNALAAHPMLGALFETAAVGEIRKQNSAISTPAALYHWRTQAGAEVDVVLERDGRLFPIEIKLTSQPSKRDARGLEAFRATYPNQNIAPGLILAPTKQFRKISDNDFTLPWNAVVEGN